MEAEAFRDGLADFEEQNATVIGVSMDGVDSHRAFAEKFDLNFPLLVEVGRAGVPVLLKRGFSATLEEWLCSAEYLAREGNRDIVLCERGVRRDCSWSHARSDVIEPLRRATPLPVIGDPSHATGEWTRVEDVSRAALEAGVHGLLVEVLAPGTVRSELRCDPHQGVPEDVLGRIFGMAAATAVSVPRDLGALPVGAES